MSKTFNPEILEFIDRLAETGSHYRIEQMKDMYTEDLGFLVLGADGEIMRFSKKEMLDEFAARGAAGDAPLSTEKRVLHVEQQGETATAVLFRRMSEQADAAFYELRMRKVDGKWRVTGETVLPWPDLSNCRGFLPPRGG